VAAGAVAAPVPAAKNARNELTNPGFETDTAWVRQGPAQNASFDTAVHHSGTRSARCTAATPGSQGGFLQEFELNQDRALPLLVSGWSRAENVSGPRNNHYSVWCDVKYARQLRPGRIDKAVIASFAVGTHDWQQAQVLLTPERPIKTVKLYALFRHHTGTVWFDDFSLRQLPAFEPPDLPKPTGVPHSLSAGNGFQLALLPDGAIASVTAAGVRCPAKRWRGLFVGDYNRRKFSPVSGETTFSPGSATLTASLTEANLEVTARFTSREGAVEIAGWTFEVLNADSRRILLLHVYKP